MDSAHALKLAAMLDELQIWDSEEIMVDLQHGFDGVVQPVNLVTVLHDVPTSIERRKFLADKANRYYLPPSFNSNTEATRRNQVVPSLAEACARVS